MLFYEEENDVAILKGNAEHCSWIMHSLHIMGVCAHIESRQQNQGLVAHLLVPRRDRQRAKAYASEYISNTNKLLANSLKVEEVETVDETGLVAE